MPKTLDSIDNGEVIPFEDNTIQVAFHSFLYSEEGRLSFILSFITFPNSTLRSQMELLRHQTPPSSTALNPNAPPFIPMSFYDVVDDFSDQWWSLVHSSPCFRDYWLRECFSEPLFPEEDDLFDSVFADNSQEEQVKRGSKEMVAASAFKWNNSKAHGRGEAPRYVEKAPKVVNVKPSPRPIQQPR